MPLSSVVALRGLAALACLPASLCVAQHTPINRFDVYTGFSDLSTPGLNDLNQMGFHLQAGVTAARWFSYGFDYSTEHGSSTITPALAPPALQQQLAGALPPGYQLNLPYDITVQSFSAGGQLVVRHYPRATFFVRPVLAAFHGRATTHPNDPINTFVSAQIAPSGTLTDWYGAYGAGGGVEFPIAHHFGARAQFDAGWNHPFSNILATGHWSYRYSVGPAFHFGQTSLH